MKQLMTTLLLFMVVLSSAVMAQKTPAPVFVAVAQFQPFVDDVEALGTLQSNENVNLASTVIERISAIHFTDNQRVKKGYVLIEMDTAQEEAELLEEESLRDEAQKQVNRLRPLVKKGSASQAALDEQERNLKSAKARIQAIDSRIEERRIIAPFDGVVGIRNISVGALAQPGTLLTTIDDDRIMKLDFALPELFLATLKPGIEVTAMARAYPDRLFTGTITSINSRIDPVTRAITTRALLDNKEGLLKAGMLMQVIVKKNPRDALLVPEEAIVKKERDNFVMRTITQEGKTIALQTQVKIGSRRQGEVEILEGLQPGEQVITHGLIKVRQGKSVQVRGIQKGDETLSDLLSQNHQGLR